MNTLSRSMLVAGTGLVLTTPGGLTAQGFVDITAQAGLTLPLEPATVWGRGACCGDFDGDGDQDLVVPGATTSPIRYFQNDGTARFTERTAAADLGRSGVVRCCSAADVDNDGDLDLFVGRDHEPNLLFINDGTAVFREQAQLRGIDFVGDTYSASFGDYDNDGLLDLHLGIHNDTVRNVMYHNRGDGFFADVTGPDRAGSLGLTFIAVFVDYNEDGWPDVFVAQDKGGTYGPNELHENNRDGTFTDVSAAMDVSFRIEAMGIDFSDVFNDGGVDVYMTDGPADHLFHAWDPALGRYLEAQHIYGIFGGPGFVGWACMFLDYDNDGWQDLYVVHRPNRNHLYRNPGAPGRARVPWTEVGEALGAAHRGSQFTGFAGDFDDDGREDLVHLFAEAPSPNGGMLMLQRNTVDAGNWIKVKTVGTVSNRDGIGARIAVTVGATTCRQWVRSGTGYLSGSDPRRNFGLGTATVADRVEITWPLGRVQYYTGVAANRILTAVEPELVHQGTARPGGSTRIRLSVDGDVGLLYAVPVSLTPAPPIRLPSGRTIPVHLDPVAQFSLAPGNTLVPNSIGTLPASGAIDCALHLPNIPALSGLTLYTTAVTFDATFPEAIRTILPQVAIPVR